MTLDFVAAYLHLLAAVLFVGYALFWTVMATGLARQFDRAEASRLLNAVKSCRWPHVGVPPAARLPLPLLGWGFLLVLVVTGVTLNAPSAAAGSGTSGFAPLFIAKLALVAVLIVAQIALFIRPGPALALGNLAVALAVVCLSALSH